MSEITRGAIGMPFEMAMESELSRRQFHSIAQALLAERDQVRAEVAGLRTGYEAYERVNAELKAENETLRKDAERYQWLRGRESAEDPEISVTRWNQISPDRAIGEAPRLEVLDAAIDAAMGKGERS